MPYNMHKRADRSPRHNLGIMTTAQTFTVTTRREGTVTFTSNLSDAEVLATLQAQRSSFAQDLALKFERLSPAQYAWAHKLAVDAQSPAPADNSSQADFGPMFAAFEAARSKGAKRMTLRFEGISIKPNRDLTSLWVTSQTESEMGEYGMKPKYLGKVTRSGLDSRLPDDVKATIMAAASDPLTAAIRYGKLSGECSCCGRELTRKDSIERGIGPICAEKFGW